MIKFAYSEAELQQILTNPSYDIKSVAPINGRVEAKKIKFNYIIVIDGY
jgi:hypothetical protein